MFLIDTHCHLDFKIFDQDRHQVLDEAYAKGVKIIVHPSIGVSNFQDVLMPIPHLVRVYPTFGLHPCFILQHRLEDILTLDTMIQTHSPIAIGECGLDFLMAGLQTQDNQQKQIDLFAAQLILAKRYDLPLILHARKSLDQMIQMIKKIKTPLRGVVHCFSGSLVQAQQLIQLGFYLGFGGPITYPRAKKLQMLIKTLPLDRLLLESDAPDQPVFQAQYMRNTPQSVHDVCQKIAELRECSFERVASQTTENAKQLFRLSV